MPLSRSVHLVLLGFFTVVGLQFPVPLAQAASYAVTTSKDVVNPDDGVLSLREAISAASAAPDADIITLPSGTYQLTNGVLSIASDLTLKGAGRDATILDGGSTQQILSVYSGSIILQDLTFQNGYNSDNGGAVAIAKNVKSLTITNSRFKQNQSTANYSAGGALYVEAGFQFLLHITNTEFKDNQSFVGGAICVTAGDSMVESSVTIDHSTFYGNEVNDLDLECMYLGGGAIAIGAISKLTVNDSTFSGNRVISDTCSSTGGAINAGGAYPISSATFEGNTFDQNEAVGEGSYGQGGAVAINAYQTIFTRNRFTHNISTGSGGAIYAINQSSLQIDALTIDGNQAGYLGGGLYIYSSDTVSTQVKNASFFNNTVTGELDPSDFGGGSYHVPSGGAAIAIEFEDDFYSSTNSSTTLQNLTLAKNVAAGCGGGIYIASSFNDDKDQDLFSLKNLTIAENTASSGGGVCMSESFKGTTTLENSIVSGNSATTGADCFGTINSLGYNLMQDPKECTVTWLGTDITGFASMNDVLVTPAVGDGTSPAGYPHYELFDASLARDAGSEDANCVRPDQLGKNAYGRCDIGAIEYDTTEYDADGDGQNESGGDCNDGDSQSYCHALEVDGDDIDNNCNGYVDEPQSHLVNGTPDDDLDHDGYTETEGDCDDRDSNMNPDATDYLNDGIDSDCDCLFDEDDDTAVAACSSTETEQTTAIATLLDPVSSLSSSERSTLTALIKRQTHVLFAAAQHEPHFIKRSADLLSAWKVALSSTKRLSTAALLEQTHGWLVEVNQKASNAELSQLAHFVKTEAKKGVDPSTILKDLARFLTANTKSQGFRLFGKTIF